MTLNANDARNEYTASAAQTVFNYTFKIYDSTDLDVYVTPSGADCSDADLTTSYTVSGVGNEAGGTITLTTPSAAGDLVTIVSSIPTSRTTDYQNNGDFRPDTVNDDFDRNYSLVKQIQDVANRSLQFSPCLQGATALSLPAPIAKNFLQWKSDLSGLENYEFTSGAATTDAYLVSYNTRTVGGYLDNQNVADYAELRTNLAAGDYVAGDVVTVTDTGIAGDFVVEAIGSNVDNGGTIITGGSFAAVREGCGYLDIEWFGATTAASDQSDKILNTIVAAAGMDVLIPSGKTFRADTLNATSITVPVSLIGNGTLDGNGTDTSYLSIGSSIDKFWCNGPVFDNCFAACQVELDTYKVSNIKIKHCTSKNGQGGFEFDCDYDDLLFYGNTVEDITATTAGKSCWGIRAGNNDAFDSANKQQFARVFGNKFRELDKTTNGGNVMGALIYGDHIIITGNHVENIQNSFDGDDAEGLYTKSREGLIANNTLINAGTGAGSIALKGDGIGGKRMVCANNNMYWTNSGDFTGSSNGIWIESQNAHVSDNRVEGFGGFAISTTSDTLESIAVLDNSVVGHRGQICFNFRHSFNKFSFVGNTVDGCDNSQTSIDGAEILSISNLASLGDQKDLDILNNSFRVPTNASTTTLSGIRLRQASATTIEQLNICGNSFNFTGSTTSNRYDVWLDNDGTISKLNARGTEGQNVTETLRIDNVSNITGADIDWSGYVNRQALSANLTLYAASERSQSIDPNGANRNIIMPAESNIKGEKFYISNRANAAEDLVIRDDSDTSTIVTISQNEGAVVWSDGTGLQGFVGSNT